MPYQMPNNKMLIRCPKCRQQFQYEEKDKQIIEYEMPNHLRAYVMITCPACKCGIILPF